jgi:signal transduction histidine kinase/ActR/RegA family two-component response regulator
MKLRYYILLLLLLFGLGPLLVALLINLPLILERTALFYQKAYLQNLRADFRDLDQHLASRDEVIRLLAKLPDPSLIIKTDQQTPVSTTLAQTHYTHWMNQLLADQRDIIQILFVDNTGHNQFWLHRNLESGLWHTTATPPLPANQDFLNTAMQLKPGEVMVSRIRVNAHNALTDPRQLLTLQLATPIKEVFGTTPEQQGLLLITVDVGGLAQFYHDTLWVTNYGHYLRPGQPIPLQAEAFRDFPNLQNVLKEKKLALTRSTSGREYLWIPMFLTEDDQPLWVARPVDSSPIADFRDALIARVLSIVFALVILVFIMAHLIANRTERFSSELIDGVRHILRDGHMMHFQWRGPLEIHELGQQLTELSRFHYEHLSSEREHTRQLEQSNRYKSEFLTNVSHELRTPLNAILLLSKLLADQQTNLDPDQRRQAQVIHEAGRDLRDLIDNILDISRIEAGQVTVSLEWVELRPMLEELVTLIEPMFTAKQLHKELDITAQAPLRVYTDRDKLRQILKNLLANAVKFTHQGHVTLQADWCDHASRPCVFHVIDTGIGIAPGKESIIFEAFRQADGSTRRRYGGTGLGLSISRDLATLLDGEISVSSQLGIGSCFTLKIPLILNPDERNAVEIIQDRNQAQPLALVETDSIEPVPAPTHLDSAIKFDDISVVLVERDVQCLVNLAKQLRYLGLTVQTAADINEAVETLHDDPNCSLILLATLANPTITCEQIKRLNQEWPQQQFLILVLGAPDDPAQNDYLTAGAQAFLPKPITASVLTKTLQTLLEPLSVATHSHNDD